ncbi:hypothetical protein FH972_023118 [Carpinus fangiana]|uniref:phosphoribosylaminoimidazole carboxylase n=1 Tax=Carpinus fangiana TaxID=176857 RepID=A0A5N6KU89_9ROSI|nr:hypothetical protein FH972_023118 [Carpinus fangiana]
MSEAFPTVGLLGGGQLGRMLIEAANRLNIKVNVLDTGASPSKLIAAHGGHIDGKFTDRASIQKLAASSDVLTVEIEHVDTHVLEEVARDGHKVEPSWQTIRTIQDKFLQKQTLVKADVAVAKYEELQKGTEEELSAIGDRLGYPLMLKSKTQAYDGKGNHPVYSAADVPSAISTLKDRPLYAEQWADFSMELAVMVVKTKDQVLSYPTVETVHEDSICKLVYAPARNVSSRINAAAQDLARRAVACFTGKGVFGVEMFLLRDGRTLLINEIAPRPHNSGHYTIEACRMSQYEAHLRAVCDLPVAADALRMREPAVMLNILGGADPHSHLRIQRAALALPGASIHMYAKGDARPGRKMGHVTLTRDTVAAAEAALQPLLDLVAAVRAERIDIAQPKPSPAPPTPQLRAQPGDARPPSVAVLMGSDSDLKTMTAGLDVLERFGIPHTVRITSAHRTPTVMADFATAAAASGIKVIIAAAGGAAHLPGMCAAYTSLPVIGVPVKASVLDGVDSLYSEVQMPRGVPLATVGIGNSTNAALLAARILGVSDAEIRGKVQGYAEDAETEVRGKDQRMDQVGRQEYAKGMGI